MRGKPTLIYVKFVVLINPCDEFWNLIKVSVLKKNNINITNIIKNKNWREILSLIIKVISIAGIKNTANWIFWKNRWSKVYGILNNCLIANVKFSNRGRLDLINSSLWVVSPKKEKNIKCALVRNKKILNVDKILIAFIFLFSIILLLIKYEAKHISGINQTVVIKSEFKPNKTIIK